jgi:DNA polymerase III subunit delta
VTLVVGDEEFLVARAVQRAVNAAVAGGDPAGVHDVAAADLTAAELLELTSPSLFGEARIVVVRSAQDAAKDLAAALVDLAAAGDESVGLVVAHAGGAKGKALLEGMKGAGAQVVEVMKIRSQRDREQFVLDEIAAAGGAIDRDAAADLVASIGADLRELATACTQLVADCGSRVHVDHVGAYYRGRAESTGFAVADRACEGDVAAALETLRWAFATHRHPRFRLVPARRSSAWQARRHAPLRHARRRAARSRAGEDDELLRRAGHGDVLIDRAFDADAPRRRVDQHDEVELQPLRQLRRQPPDA